jgi:hypothetical protein
MRALTYLAVAGVLSLSVATSAYASGAPVNPPYMMSVRILDENAGAYQVEVDNLNPFRFITGYVWTAPPGMTILKITGTSGGKCLLTGSGTLTCNGSAAGPRDQDGVGESLLVNFTATGEAPQFVATSYGGYYIHFGVIGSVAVQTSANFGDLPLCKKGEKSTQARRCSNT